MFAHPGKKLTFMGTEFGQFKEWDNSMGIDFCLFEFEKHKKLNDFVKYLNKFYTSTPALYEIDYSWEGFNWIIPDDYDQNVVAFARKDKKGKELICIVNFSPEPRNRYKVGVNAGKYKQVLNSDWEEFGGTTKKTNKLLQTKEFSIHGKNNCVELNIPSFGAIFLTKSNFAV